MRTYSLIYRQTVPRPREEVFAFFTRPENLAAITPPSLGFRILTPSPIPMGRGALIDYTIGILGIRIRWRTLITAFEPPVRFVDEQLKGPYSFWHHTHSFTETAGGTLITDEVRYVMPAGILGTLAHTLFARRQLERIFAYRETCISALFSVHTGRGAT